MCIKIIKMPVMRQLLLSLLMLLSIHLSAQFGFSGGYLSGEAENWTASPGLISGTSVDLPGTGWQVGIDYWLRLKNYRVEFLPTLAYSQQESNLQSDISNQFSGAHLFIHTNIYPFDFKGDCDCPTFSKEGPSFEKGLFIQISPGISQLNYEYQHSFYQDSPATSSETAFSIGAGLGLDLGISDLLTITPVVSLRYYPSVNWEILSGTDDVPFLSPIQAESTLIQYQAGLRLGIRLDQ